MANARKDWSKSSSGNLWMPAPSRRALIAGAGASAAALLLGCGDSGHGGATGTGGGPASARNGGAGGTPAGSGGMPGSGGMAPAGTGGSAPAGTGGGAAGAPGTGGQMASDAGMAAEAGMPAADTGGMIDPNAEVPSPPAMAPACTRRERQIVGPYPASSVQLNRADIRSDPGDKGLVKPGVPLRLVFRVGKGAAGSCTATAGAIVNVWQCDAKGVYSAYGSEGTAGKQYLRGYQMTDSSGVAEFLSIYPGPYSGRCIHIHFSVRMNTMVSFPGGAYVSQMYFPEEVNDEVVKQAPYSSGGRTRNSSDGFYSSLMLGKLSKSGRGWVAELDIAV